MNFAQERNMYNIDDFYAADEKAGAEMLMKAKKHFSKAAQTFLWKAATCPHRVKELEQLAKKLFWDTYDIEAFYTADERTGEKMLMKARENFQKDQAARTFLGMAAAQPHEIKELKELAGVLLWDTQHDYFRSMLVTKNYPQKYMDDLMGAMAVGFFKELPKFDALHYAAGTFFTPRLKHCAYEELVRMKEMVPEHKIQIKRMLLDQRDALRRAGIPVTVQTLAEARPDISIRDVQELFPFLSDESTFVSWDTFGDGGSLQEPEGRLPNPEEIMIENDKQCRLAQVFKSVFTSREQNILFTFCDNGQKLQNAKRQLMQHYSDITDDEIRKVWSDAANRVQNYAMQHPEVTDYLGSCLNLYAHKNKTTNMVRTEDEVARFDQYWDTAVNTVVCEINDNKQMTLETWLY